MAVVDLTQENFEDVVTGNETVVVDFWAPWCGPCRAFAPIYEQVAARNPDIVFAKVNTEDQQGLGAHFQVRSIPTLMIFREQVIVFAEAGMLPAAALEEVITQVRQLDMTEVHEAARPGEDTQHNAD